VLGRRARASLVLVVVALAASACTNPWRHDDESDRVALAPLGACRDLKAADLGRPTNTSAVVPCSRRHTAQTFAVGTLPAGTGSAYDDKRHGSWVFATCSRAFRDFLGVDESLALRVQLSWAWFRPSARGWKNGARWYRCDLVGGPTGATELRDLPTTARGLFASARPDAWMTCALGAGVTRGARIPCSQKHAWRAVTTVKVGQPGDAYPGDRVVQVRSREFCQASVGGWLHYPPDFDFGFTWFHDDQWAVGNRRAICWARTAR
jgi:hypothetical protein